MLEITPPPQKKKAPKQHPSRQNNPQTKLPSIHESTKKITGQTWIMIP